MEKVIKKFNLGEEPTDLEFWLTQTPQQRLAALQVLRERYIKFFYNGIRPEFQRICTTSRLK